MMGKPLGGGTKDSRRIFSEQSHLGKGLCLIAVLTSSLFKTQQSKYAHDLDVFFLLLFFSFFLVNWNKQKKFFNVVI